MKLPLEGIRILDLSRLLPGPLCTQLLADLGAEVIKIEDHAGGDYSRWFPPKQKVHSVHFLTVNRNKKSIRLDLRAEKGKEIFKQLCKTADVVLETFRPGAMDRLGLGYEDIKKVNPEIIYCSLTGFGQDSPYKNVPGHDINYISVTGIQSTTGSKEGKPIIPGIPIADTAGTFNATIALLAALYGKKSNGNGQYIDIALTDSAILFQALSMGAFGFSGENPQMSNETLASKYAYYDVYEAKDGKYLAFGNVEEKFWSEFLKAIDREDLMKDMHAEEPRQSEVKAEITAVVKTKTVSEWMDLLKDYDVCITPVNNYAEALQDPHVKSRGLWFYGDDPVEGKVMQMSYPAKFSDYKPGWRTPPPKLGENTEEIIKELGYNDEQIKELLGNKVI